MIWTCCLCEDQVDASEFDCEERMCYKCYGEHYCDHKTKTYQPEERDTNVPESYTCDECGKEFDIPEPDWDAEIKESVL